MWRDEVRAFSVATRAASWAEMFSWLPEEGHPALWYMLLRAGHALTGTQYVMPVIAALVGVATAYLILRHAPFSGPLRLLSVFGAFLAYELTVVARNYGIGVLLIVGACVAWDKRQDRPWMLALLLMLLANTSVHASVASALLAGLWLLDVLWQRDRLGVALVAIVAVAGSIVLALATASPPAEMAYASSLHTLTPSRVMQALFVDPGLGLRGTDGADLTAVGELPWVRFGIDERIVGRIATNLAVLAAAWGLRRNRLHLIALVATILCFELVFRTVYPGALRHLGLLAFLIFGIAWLAILSSPSDDRAGASRRISLGLLPLFAIQSLALPFTAVKHVLHVESQSSSLAQAIADEPRLAGAILMSEPEPLMESLPYYAGNPIYFPRQREFDFRTYFDREQRQQSMTLSNLVAIADGVSVIPFRRAGQHARAVRGDVHMECC
jgi:hypothetical protein